MALAVLALGGAVGTGTDNDDTLSMVGSFYSFAKVSVPSSGNVTFDIDWTWKNISQGGHDSVLRYVFRGEDMLEGSSWVSVSNCLGNVTASYDDVIAGAEPPLCHPSATQGHSTWVFSLDDPGTYTIIIARGGDFLERVDISLAYAGATPIRAGIDARSYSATLEDFQGRPIVSATALSTGVNVAWNASKGIHARDGLLGVYSDLSLGIDTMELSVDGPESRSGEPTYWFAGESAGTWLFRAEGEAVGMPLVHFHVLDVDLP